jgi:hypothetical protein
VSSFVIRKGVRQIQIVLHRTGECSPRTELRIQFPALRSTFNLAGFEPKNCMWATMEDLPAHCWRYACSMLRTTSPLWSFSYIFFLSLSIRASVLVSILHIFHQVENPENEAVSLAL